MTESNMQHFTPLETLFAAQRSQAQPMFLTPQRNTMDWQEWLIRVAQWRQTLQAQTGQRWALYHPCAGEFSAGLFALLSLNKTACLPGNRQPEFVKQLSQRVDGFVGDFENLVPTLSRSSEAPAESAITELADITLNNHEPLLQVFTSGSSGEPQAIPKTLRQMSQEVMHLHSLWGHHRKALVTGTVSHQHIYGLLFRVLWPLAAGWCSDCQPCEYFEELALRHYPSPSSSEWPRLLVSSPTHLSRVPENLDSAVSHGLAEIFSSGAPLMRENSLHAKKHLGTGVLEIFGSSETGGIAWRQQEDHAAEAKWQPVPGIEVRLTENDTDISDCLEVRSSHLPDEHQWYRTSDRVRIDEQGRFILLGRADRIVKAEGKRVSLDEMEKHLIQLPWVEHAHLLQLEGARTEMAAVVVLSREGQTALKTRGKRAINIVLRDKLLSYFERPTLPRKWRYVDALPVNSQGKLQRLALQELFKKETPTPVDGSNNTRPSLPTTLSSNETEGQQTLQLRIPEDLLYFEGHFEQAPILPGVVQIHWAEHFARNAFSPDGEFLRLEVIKFQKVITPGAEVTLDLSYDSVKNKIIFAYHSPRGQHSSGRIVLAAPASSPVA